MPAIAQELNPGKTAPVTGPSSSPSLSQDYANYTGMINQINSIDQLRDVSPQSWSYEALKNLVENYGCIVGYPDRTYRGDRPLTRNEFAAGLNACLTQIEKRILEARGQSRNVSSSPMIDAGMTSSGETGVQPGDQLINVFNRAFYNETERFYQGTNISGQEDPGPIQIAETLNIEGTFAQAEETKKGSATLWVIGLLVLATVIPMATYFFYVGFDN
jgi:hypothetical protein